MTVWEGHHASDSSWKPVKISFIGNLLVCLKYCQSNVLDPDVLGELFRNNTMHHCTNSSWPMARGKVRTMRFPKNGQPKLWSTLAKVSQVVTHLQTSETIASKVFWGYGCVLIDAFPQHRGNFVSWINSHFHKSSGSLKN